MDPQISYWILGASTLMEVLLVVLVFAFYGRLKKSEQLVSSLQTRQAEFLQKLDANARLEKEIIDTFTRRQEELTALEEKLHFRATEMRRLLEQAENFTKSPQFLRQTILSGFKRGQSPEALAQATGLSVDEVELILDQPKI
jgi:hypothetical protein